MATMVRTLEDGVMCAPSSSDSYVRRRAAELALPEVRRWRCIGLDRDDEALISELMPVIGFRDGFDIVKALERAGWCGDDSLVEIFSQNFMEQALSELTEQWERCRVGAVCRSLEGFYGKPNAA